MDRVKLFGPSDCGQGAFQGSIDKWTESTNPTIKNVTLTASGDSKLSWFMIAITYTVDKQ